MCLIAFAIHASARWPLVIASNRDEFYDRPALPLASWQTDSGQTVISGRDMRAGGTWLGMTQGGRIAMLTNVRELPQTGAPKSRGELALRWLEGDMSAEQFMARTDSSAYGGFNLVVGDFEAGCWTWLSNRSFAPRSGGAPGSRPTGDGWQSTRLPPGVYGLSNAALNTPWPKTQALTAALTTALARFDPMNGAVALEEALWAALASRQSAAASDLPDTGLPVALEKALSSVFVEAPARGYGTRCSTLVVVSREKDGLAAGGCSVRVEEKTHLFAPGQSPASVSSCAHLNWAQALLPAQA